MIAVVVAGVLIGREMRAGLEPSRVLAFAGLLGDRGLRHQRLAVPAGRYPSARKAAILDAARRGLITDRTAARHVAALDEHILRASLAAHHEDA